MSGWQPIETAPYQKVIEVRNEVMEEPVKATRGFKCNLTGMVSERQDAFTTVYTPHKFFPTPAGNLVIATQWRDA